MLVLRRSSHALPPAKSSATLGVDDGALKSRRSWFKLQLHKVARDDWSQRNRCGSATVRQATALHGAAV